MYEYGHELSQDDENRQETLYFLKNASDEGHIDALFEYGKNIIKNLMSINRNSPPHWNLFC